MSYSVLLIGILIVIAAIIFIRRPEAYFSTNPRQDVEDIKKHLAGFTREKKTIIRALWGIMLIIGAFLILASISRILA